MVRETPLAILMGSDSDFDTIVEGLRLLDGMGLRYQLHVLSAHRSPQETIEFASSAHKRGIKVIIAIAGKAAHLAGVVAAHTTLPVLGIPAEGGSLGGLDALLSTVQMPGGVPVATLGIGRAGGTNAALLAARILALSDPRITERLERYREEQRKQTLARSEQLGERLRARLAQDAS
jgi:phosphoribosylaminoimidazole carboxylase PurE protein